MDGRRYALSAVFGPDGCVIGEPLIDEEGIVYADIDLNDLITPKLMHDITGHYNQFSVLSLNLNKTPHKPLTQCGGDTLPDGENKDASTCPNDSEKHNQVSG